MKIVNYGQNLIMHELVTQRWHSSSQPQFAVGNPIVNLLIRMVPGVFGRVQRGCSQFVGIALTICTMTLSTDPEIDFPT